MPKTRYNKADLEEIMAAQLDNLNAMHDLFRITKFQNELLELENANKKFYDEILELKAKYLQYPRR